MSNSILIVTGEVSGDMHAANLVKELKLRSPELTFAGMGGTAMKAAGVDILVSSDDVAVVGFSEVFAKMPNIVRARKRLIDYIERKKPLAVILLDYPGFNLRLAKAVKERGIPVIYYISPQIWAWAGGRIKKMKKFVDLMLVILPFEEQIYREAGVPVQFVGNPLLDEMPALSNTKRRADVIDIGILPGSRTAEVNRILPAMVESAKRIKVVHPNATFYLPLAPALDPDFVRRTFLSDSDIEIVKSPAYERRKSSTLSLTASGTATLENAILGLPMAIVYSVSLPTYIIALSVIRIRKIGLVNVVAGRIICPEFIQYGAIPRFIADYALEFLQDTNAQQDMLEALTQVRESLGGPGASVRAAEAILKHIEPSMPGCLR